MSLYDYKVSKELFIKDVPFYGLIMAAMRKADDSNLEMLKGCWPEVWKELEARYWSPGGHLPGEE